jgi:hypothetical protein
MNKKDYKFLKKEAQNIKHELDKIGKQKNPDDNRIRYLLNLLENTVNKMENIINNMY